MSRTVSVFNKLEKAGTYAENAVLVTILISMILLAGTQIFLRNVLDTSLFWGDEMLRMMVLWLTVAGGLAAALSTACPRIKRHVLVVLAAADRN